MDAPDASPASWAAGLVKLGQAVRRAFAEFLTLPSLIVAGFILLAAITTMLDYSEVGLFKPFRAALRQYFFRDAKATSDLLGTIAGSVITITSITFSLLLLAVQQAAGALTHQVYDQFLRRRINQVYFGYFTGLALYLLVILATVDPPFNPVIGAALALLLTVVALHLLIVLLYTTINQMRPAVVIDAIHDRTLIARQRQQSFLRKIRQRSQTSGAHRTLVLADKNGYLVRIHADALAAAAREAQAEVEIVLLASVGAYVAFQDAVAEVRCHSPGDGEAVAQAVPRALIVEQQRDLDTDPAYGVEQLTDIAWTSISTAKSNPSPGLMVLHSLRDLLARWTVADVEENAAEKLPVVYTDDLFAQLLDAFESLAVVASESMQSQTISEILRTFAVMFTRLPFATRSRAEDLVLRTLPALGEHVLTAELDTALSSLADALSAAGRGESAAKGRSTSLGRFRRQAGFAINPRDKR